VFSVTTENKDSLSLTLSLSLSLNLSLSLFRDQKIVDLKPLKT
jgi:hypothetical protein